MLDRDNNLRVYGALWGCECMYMSTSMYMSISMCPCIHIRVRTRYTYTLCVHVIRTLYVHVCVTLVLGIRICTCRCVSVRKKLKKGLCVLASSHSMQLPSIRTPSVSILVQQRCEGLFRIFCSAVSNVDCEFLRALVRFGSVVRMLTLANRC